MVEEHNKVIENMVHAASRFMANATRNIASSKSLRGSSTRVATSSIGITLCGSSRDHSSSSATQQQQLTHPSSSSPSPSIDSYISSPTTHFGYENVSTTEKEYRVKQVFEKIAENYDIMNDFMSAGLHRYWKDELLKMTGVEPMSKVIRRRASLNYAAASDATTIDVDGTRLLSILDVAGGTGDVAFRFINAANCEERAKSSGKDEISVTVCDINPEMLRVGEKRARTKYGNALIDESNALQFLEGNAQYLPFEDDKFDLYTIAFGLRNVTDVDMALRDAHRVLKPGGRFLCLEFSHVTNIPLAQLYEIYSFHVIPKLGEVVANDRDSYQYLVESIRKFCTQDELVTRMESAGFEHVKYTNMTGGIVALHEGYKPL